MVADGTLTPVWAHSNAPRAGAGHANLDYNEGFLAKKGHTAAEVEAMHMAWTKAVLLQAILWSRPYTKEGDF